MAKDSEKNIKDRIKKVVPQNEWLVNVTKSLGFASLDVVKELIPNTYSTADWNKDFVMSATEMAKNIRDNNGIRNAFNRQFGNLPQVKAAKKVRENALSDLRSGKLYNQNRELGLNDDGEFDFSFDDDSGPMFIDDDGSGDGDETGSVDSANDNKPPVTIINTMPLAKTISASTEANITTMNAIAEQNMAVESEKIMLTKQTFNITMNALDTINSNLSLLVQFNSDSTAKYQAAALKYFEQSLEFMKPPAEEEKAVQKFLNPFTAEGGLKLDEYFGVVKDNIKQIKDENLILSSISDFLTNPEMIEALSKNPIGMLMTAGMKKMIPKSIKSSLNDLDKNVNAILPALLARINTFEDSNDPLLQTLNKVFGYKQKLSYEVDLGSYKKDAVAWDGESKKALVEVIPSYLRRIESALTGDEERIFNYSTGKFTDINDIKKKYDEKLSDMETSGFYSVKSQINDVVNKLNLSSAARDQFDKDLVEYFRAMTKKGSLIRHTNRKNADGQEIDEFALEGLFDYDVDRTNLMKRVLSLLPRDVLTEMGTTAITDSRERTQKHLNEVRDNPNLSGYSYMHNDLDAEGKMRYNRYREGQKDGFGLTQLDYLRDIRAALIHGIRVFPKYYDEDLFGPPNRDILEKESNEKKERRERLKREAKKNAPKPKADDDGISTNDAANLSDDKWNELKPKKEKSDNTLANNLDKINDKVSDAVFDILYGSDNYKDIANEKLNKILKAREKGESIFSTVKGMFGDTIKAFKSYFTGQAYITSDGVKVEGRADNMLEKIKGFFTGTKDKLVGKDGEEGMLHKFAKDFMDGYQKFKVSLFGEKKLSEMQNDSKETIQSLMQKVKERLPKAAGHGFAAAMVKTMFASNLGILGNFLLPGGPIGAALTGTTIGFLRQSETFNKYMFGEKDADGNRVGGLISKAWQDKYSEYKDSIKKGAGLGILASLVLPGGPIAGAMLGIGTSIAAKNESFQEFLFGENYKDQDKKSLMNGAFGKAFKSMAGEESDPGLSAFLGTAGLGIGIAQGVGLLPSFLLPGGPIMGAMLGLAGGIAASSNKFQEFLLGEKDVDGKRYGGLLTKAANWFSLTFAQPLKLKFTEFNDFLYGMLRKNVFDPLARSFEPIIHGVKNVFINAKDSLVEAFTNITHPIVKAFKENIIDPISKVVKVAILNPIKWILKKTFGLMTKTLVGIITSPISIAGRLADKYNEYSAVRQEKFRRRREYDKNTAKEDRNYYDRKAAGKLTKEEKKEAIAKGVSYRKGKTWGEKKKEQKDAYKEEMAKRKDRRKQMQEQFEEDKKFAKENGFKYRSKKQKEKREQELKEKERWIQEQQLLQAQDSNEKLEKITDNVVNIADYQNKREDKIVSKMDELGRNIINVFSKALGLPAPENKDEDQGTGKVIPFPNKNQGTGKVIPFPNKNQDQGSESLGEKIENNNIVPFPKTGKQTPKGKTVKDAFNETVNEAKELVKNIKDAKKQKTEEKEDKPKVVSIHKFKKENPEPDDDPDKKSKVIDITKRLRKDGKSHKDGLDKVPEDGYIAELHEGEMVVPKKPAGKLRKMMNKAGKGFRGLGDILAEVSEDDRRDREDNALGLTEDEEDRLKELEDRKRRESIVKKAGNKVKGAGKFVGNTIKAGVSTLGDALSETSMEDVDYSIASREQKEKRPKLADRLNGVADNINSIDAYLGGKVRSRTERVVEGIDNAGLFVHNKLRSFGDTITGGIGNGIKKLFGKDDAAEKREIEDDALGLTENEEDRLKELEDMERRENATRKDIDFVQDQVELKDKEKAERKWRDKLLSSISGVGKVISTGSTSLFDLLGKGFDLFKKGISSLLSGLGSLALPLAALGSVFAWNKYKDSEEYKESRTDVDNDGDGQGDFIYDNTDVNIARGFISARKPLIINPLKKLKKTFVDPVIKVGKGVGKGFSKVYNSKLGQKTLQPIGKKYTAKLKKGKEFIFGSKTTKVVSETSDNVIDFTKTKLAKEAAEGGSGKVVKKVVSESTESVVTNKGLIGKVIDMAKSAIKAIGNKLSEKFPKLASKMGGLADELLGFVLKHSDGIVKRFAKRITTFLTRVGAGASTGFTLDVIFGACDLVSGATAGNAGNLFGVSPENVDLKMRIISSVLQVVTNFNALGIIGLINEITSAMFNFNFLRSLATGIYNLISDVDLTNRITAKQIDSCKSIEEALAIMGITDPNEIAKLKDGDTWKNFADVENEELGGVISPTEQMELARLQYNLENGTKLSSQAFIDKESKTLGSKFFDATKKLFTGKSSDQKINMLENKAQEKRDKAAEYEAKAAESNNIFSKGWNKAMAFLNNKSADRKLKKVEKVKTKSANKKAKAEQKLAMHEQKAATSTGISKWYHEWRAKRNSKKIEKYTINEDGVVTPTQTDDGSTISPEQEKIDEAKANILSPEEVLLLNDIPEGEIMYDGYGNMYDHNGNYIGNSEFTDDAGQGDGEEALVPNATYTGEYKSSKKEDSKFKKVAKKVAKYSLMTMFPGAAALYGGYKVGKKLLDKKDNAKQEGAETSKKDNSKLKNAAKKAAKFSLATMFPGAAALYAGVKAGKKLFGKKDANDMMIPDDAGMGDGETTDKSKLKKAAKKGLLNTLFPTAGALYAGVKAGKKLFGKKEKPEDYQMVPVLDAEGNIISYTKQLIDETTEIKGYGEESLQVGEITKSTQVIPQMDEKGNVVSYTTIDKKSSKSKSWLSRLGSAVGSFFGIGGSSSNSSTVDNSSSVDNSVTGDTNTYNTYNGTTSEIDTSVFGPLTNAINELIGTQGNNNVDKDGNVKTGGGILRAIMDPMGYLVNNLVSLGVETYESKTGKEADMEKINQGISIFNMLRNPFGYLQSVVKGKMDPDGDGKNDKTLKEGLKEVYEDGKENVIKAKDWTVDKYNKGKDWTVDKYNKGKDWTVDKYNTAKDWTVDKYNTAKDWTVDKYNKGKKWVNRQAEMSDDVADIMMGDNNANGGFVSTAITMGSKAPTALWNMLAPEEYQLSEEVIPKFVASLINDFIVTPFKEFKEPIVEKFNETKEAVFGWMNEVKDNVVKWFTDTIKDPFMNWFNEKKEQVIEIKDKAVAWVKDTKNAVFGWFTENVSEPFMDWFDEKKEQVIEIKDKAVAWVKDTKNAVFEWFGENVSEPFKKWYEKTKSKLIKLKDKAVTWVKDTKDKVFDWFGENVKEPFTKWAIKKKKQITELKNKAVDWVKDTKDKVFDWFGENVKEPFTKWASKKKDKITEMFNSAKSWISGVKDKVVESFNKYIKEPAEEALKPLTDGISKAWSSLKTAFSPLTDLFSAVGSGDWGAVYDFITGKSKEASDKVDASADNDRFHGATNTKSLDQQVKPKNYIFNENDEKYIGKDAGRTDGGLKDKGNTHNFPFYAQADNRWGKNRIGNAYMEDSGCGPTATAMVMTHLTGQHITPDTMAKIGKDYLPGYTSYNYFPEVADKFNLNYSEANDAASIKARLMSGQPILLSGYDNSNGKMTPYTSKGHIVVATGIDGNNVQINDPRGPEYSGSYSLNNVVKGLKRGIVLSSTKDTKKVGLPTSGFYSDMHDMNGQYEYNGDLPTDDTMENLGGDVGQIKLWEKVVGYAKAFKEKLKYVYGSKAIDNNGMTTDCSGFTKHVMSRCGINIPAGSANQKNAGTGVDPSQAQAGDLVVWKGHVGLVIDSNKNMIDAGSGSVPKIRSYETDYWRSRGSYVIRRVIDPNKMVSAKVDNYHTGIGFSGVVGSQGGGDLNGGGPTGGDSTTTGGETATVEAAAPQVEMFGPFAELEKIGNSMIGAMFNGKSYQEMYDSLYAQPVTTTDTTGGTTDTTGGTNSGSTDISGISDTATAVWKFFTGKGYNKYATAGIMGNLQQESGMNPTRKQSGGGPGRGIAQWTVSEGRFKGLQSHAQSKGKDWTDLQSQLEWIDLELGGKDSTTASILKKNYGGLSGLKNASSTKWAVEAFEKSFERAGKPMWEKRYKYADDFYSKFSSAGAGIELDGNAGGGFNMATSAESAPASGIPTTMNGWAYYKQGDPKWQEDISGKKIGPSGCGMASHAMMLTTMFGKQVTPVTVGKWARKSGYWNNGMAWEMPAAVASKLGLSITKTETNVNGLGSSSLSNIKSQIKSGHPVVLSGKGNSSSYDTPFTGGGHIVLAVGVDGSGNVIINDPRDPKRTKAYTDNGILNIGTGLRGYWAFDKPSGANLPEDWASGDYTGGNSGGTSGGATGGATGGTAVEAAPQLDMLGSFAGLEKIGNNMIASIFNGEKVDLYATAAPATSDGTTNGGTNGGTTNGGGTGSVQIDETLMYSGTDGFFKALSGAAMNTYNQYKNIFPSTILAQAALESGWGKSKVAKNNKNLFGIKWTGRHNPLITVEKGLNCPGNEQGGARPYNSYKSFGDSILDHGWFLNNNGSRYNATLNAKTPAEQITALGKSGYAEAGTYGKSLQNMVNKYNLTQFNPGAGSGDGDGNTYLITPGGDAGKGDGVRASYSKSVVNNTGVNKTNVETQREIESINRKINVAVNNINTADPNAYAEILKLIMQELQAINSNTAATASGVNDIKIVSANEPVANVTTADVYNGGKKTTTRQKINTATGYNIARQIAGYQK